ncbi:MAG: cytochrome-c peroxidase [Ferruginibacter sp.]
MTRIVFILIAAVAFCSSGFNYTALPVLKTETDSIRFVVPVNFPQPVYQFENNPLTDAGFILGRSLFYDTLLSIDRSISCGNCHQPFAAFANLDHAVSHGVANCFGTRNAPPLFNLAWQKEFMWDGGVKHIEVSPLNAITSSCEMASSLDTITQRLRNSALYLRLFQNAFGSTEINSQKMLRALAQFTTMLISASSKYDRFVRHEPGGTFTKEEAEGYNLFKQHCSSCHSEPLFTDLSFRNNGLDAVSEDPGRDTITGMEADKGKFRVPSLRNIELTAPYMHDGRFEYLDQVLNHYTTSVKKNPALDTLFIQAGGKLGLTLKKSEKQRIITFLKTLTDSAFINDKRFFEYR